jgi:cysteine-rich repeat protein
MMVCDDPNDQVCEQDVEALCPSGWGLCSRAQFIRRNDGWNQNLGVVVGEIYCRGNANSSGAGHYTVHGDLNTDEAFNCHYGSSRPSCTSGYGCNERQVGALCCRPTPTCGNGIVDHPEEVCDDGNQVNGDSCLNSCDSRNPGC